MEILRTIRLFEATDPTQITWLTPIWVLSVGMLLGLIGAGLLFGLLYLVLTGLARVSPTFERRREMLVDSLFQGPLFFASIIFAAFAVFSYLGLGFVENPDAVVESLGRLNAVRAAAADPLKFEIEGTPRDQAPQDQAVPIDVRRAEIVSMRAESSTEVDIAATPDLPLGSPAAMRVRANEEKVWGKNSDVIGQAPLFDEARVETLYVKNLGVRDGTLTLTFQTRLAHPEATSIPITALFVLAIYAIYFLQALLFPKLSAVALATFKSETSTAFFWLLIGLGSVALVTSLYMPFYTFGYDIKMLKETGLTLIMVLGILQALWSASQSVADEVDGKTALTVLSKPISRASFILGKLSGIVWTTGLLFLCLGLVFLAVVAYKPIHESGENAAVEASALVSWQEMVQVVPGILLAFMETIVMASISVAISTRLPFLANFTICGAIYVLGHLTPLIVQSSVGNFEIVAFFGRLIATIFPALDHFKIDGAIMKDVVIGWDYLAISGVYCVIYATIAMLLALTSFENRDLA
ncbi:MAG TPA: hypothetical protein VGN57_13550 [Pirellulaceae bacterium]|jgi:hypothetical protein|nr:hypothetical protein [Pirellulaceae bacterium]